MDYLFMASYYRQLSVDIKLIPVFSPEGYYPADINQFRIHWKDFPRFSDIFRYLEDF